MDVDTVIKLVSNIGMPAFVIVVLLYFCLRIGANIRDAMVWMGPNVMLPIKDAFVGNVAILSQFVTKSDQLLPEVVNGLEKIYEKQLDMTTDSAATRDVVREMARVMSGHCSAETCPILKSAVKKQN